MRLELDELEAQRKKLVKKLKTLAVIGIGGLVLIVFIMGNVPGLRGNLLITLLALGVGYYYLVLKKPIREIGQYKLQLKTMMVENIVQKLDASIVFNAEKFIARENFMDSGLMSRIPTGYKGQNHFFIPRENYSVEFSEVLATRKDAGKDGNSILFSGLFFLFHLTKFSPNRTLIIPDLDLGAFEFITDRIQDWEMKDYDREKVTNERFEEKFSAFTNHPPDVKRLITSKFQQDLLGMKEKYAGNIYCSFGAPVTYLLIETRRSYFQLSIENEADNPQQMETFHNDLAECIGMIQLMETSVNEIMVGI